MVAFVPSKKAMIYMWLNISYFWELSFGYTPSKLFNFSVEQKNIKINRNISKLFHTILLNTSETQFDTSFLYFTRSQANLKSSATKSCLLLLHEPLILFTARGVLINAYGEKL